MKERISFFIHATARKKFKKKAAELASKIPEASLHRLEFPITNITEEMEIIIAGGGDGSIRGLSELLIGKDKPPTLVVMPAGSRNGFYRALVDGGSVVTAEDLQEGQTGNIRNYRPGMINGRMLNHFAGWGNSELSHSITSTSLRNLHFPRSYRSYAAGIIVIAKALTSQPAPEYLMRIVVTSPFVGSIKALPEQQLYSDQLSLISIESERSNIESAIKLVRIYCSALLGQTPNDLVNIQSRSYFKIEEEAERANIDGEIVTLNQSPSLIINRDRRSLKVAALI